VVVADAAVVAVSPAVVPEDVPLSSEHAAATRPSATTPAASLKLFLTVDSPLSWMAPGPSTGPDPVSLWAVSLGGGPHPVAAVMPRRTESLSRSICASTTSARAAQPFR
jgi:hypothetical protein